MKRPTISPQSGSFRAFALLVAALLAFGAYFFWDVSRQKAVADPIVFAAAASPTPGPNPQPMDPPHVDPQKQKVEAKQKMIRLHEASLLDFEKQRVEAKQKMIRFHEALILDFEKKLAERKDSAGKNYFSRAIAEKRSLIAKMKAEVAE